MTIRIGHGFDTHRFIAGRPLILGGVEIPYDFGLAAHSDGDAVIHALCDALLGALALGSIGEHFPDTCDSNKDLASKHFLAHIYGLVQSKAFHLVNADITVLAQAPRLLPHVHAMRTAIASIIDVDVDKISIKATTTECMGYIGQKEGLAAHAVVLLET